MITPDSEYRPQQERHVEEQLEWIPLHRDMFPSDSLGAELFPDILEGRNRPQKVFDRSLNSLKIDGRKLAFLSRFAEDGLSTLSSVLNIPKDYLAGSKNADLIRDQLSGVLNSLAITPHARLINSIFGFSVQSLPVPVDREEELIAEVNRVLTSLSQRERVVLEGRFGLQDGVEKTLEEISRVHGGSRSWI